MELKYQCEAPNFLINKTYFYLNHPYKLIFFFNSKTNVIFTFCVITLYQLFSSDTRGPTHEKKINLMSHMFILVYMFSGAVASRLGFV